MGTVLYMCTHKTIITTISCGFAGFAACTKVRLLFAITPRRIWRSIF